MSKSKCLFNAWLIVIGVGYVAYFVLSVGLVPAYANCDHAGQIPVDPTINLNMSDWIITNSVVGAVLLGILGSSFKPNYGCSQAFIAGLFIFIAVVYTLFEIVWNIVGLLMFQSYYKEACSVDDSFNYWVGTEIYFGIFLYFLIVVGLFIIIMNLCVETIKQNLPKHQSPIYQDILAPKQQAEDTPILETPVTNYRKSAPRHIYDRLSSNWDNHAIN